MAAAREATRHREMAAEEPSEEDRLLYSHFLAQINSAVGTVTNITLQKWLALGLAWVTSGRLRSWTLAWGGLHQRDQLASGLWVLQWW